MKRRISSMLDFPRHDPERVADPVVVYVIFL